MGVSERHTKRLLAAYRRDGAAALAHGNRGRKPHNAVPETAAAAVVRLASNGYAGANHSHFTELLREREGIDLSRPTVRRILVKAGIGSPRSRRSQQHRYRRRRMPQEGMLVQIDGSQHPWLEDRGPKLTLLIAVDDATGTVAQAVFRTTEDTRGYLVLLEGLVQQWGLPLTLYSDRHAAFKYNARQKPVPVETTQFARVMRDLGIQQIFALSPQAKGRVERMLETFRESLERSVLGASAMTGQHRERGVKLTLGRPFYDPGDPLGKLFSYSLATFAEFEADLIRMRSREGMASPAPEGNCAATGLNSPTDSSGNSIACSPPASIPAAVSPSSSPSRGQPSTAHSTGCILLSVRSCPLPESTYT